MIIKHGRHIWEIHEVRKGLWAYLSALFGRWLAGQKNSNHKVVLSSSPGSGATVQGIIHGVYWGLGMAVGGILGGFMVHGIGARLTFRIEAACSFAILVLFFGINNIHQHRDTYSKIPAEPGQETEDEE